MVTRPGVNSTSSGLWLISIQLGMPSGRQSPRQARAEPGGKSGEDLLDRRPKRVIAEGVRTGSSLQKSQIDKCSDFNTEPD